MRRTRSITSTAWSSKGTETQGSESVLRRQKDEQLDVRLGTSFVRVFMTMMEKFVAKVKEFSYKGDLGDYGGGFAYDSDFDSDSEINDVGKHTQTLLGAR